MTSLAWSTYVAGPKPVVTDHLPPGEPTETWSPTSSTLIYGEHDAVLVDALLTVAEGRQLADWVVGSGKNLTAIYITHGHGDHFFGARPVLARFPDARMVATPAVVAHMRQQLEEPVLEGLWRKRFPGQIADAPAVAETLSDHTFELAGEPLVAIELGHTDTDGTTALHVPSAGLVVAGDSVYNDVHVYLAESDHGGVPAWLAALDTIEALEPSAVIAGHKRAGAEDAPQTIDETRQYLHDFDELRRASDSAERLYTEMIERHPTRLNRAVVWNSAQAVCREGHR